MLDFKHKHKGETMTINTKMVWISGEELYGWFTLGLSEVQSNRKYLNSINLFPVADGDTGTNMATTIKAMVETTTIKQSFSEVIKNLAQSGLSYARGNSGILFVSYINGIAIESADNEKMSISEFASAAHKAVEYLYKAIEKPVEGTMITVISDWASFLKKNSEKYDNFMDLFLDAYQTAKLSLAKTAEQLQIHKKNNQVDAGAQGFVHFLHGLNRLFTKEAIKINAPVIKPFIDINNETYNYRYCTELYIQLNLKYQNMRSELVIELVKEMLKDIGDSMIVSINEDKLRLHVHVNQPDELVKIMSEFGSYIEQKADDMFLQLSIQKERKYPIGIVTDSIADLPDEYKLQQQITTIPLGIIVNEEVYLDKITIKPSDVFTRIDNKQHPTSTQPEPNRVKTILEALSDQYESLIVISVSAKLSGTYSVIKKEADSLIENGYKISVIDSKLNSGAQGLLVTEAIKMLEAHKSHDEIVITLTQMSAKTKIYVCLNTLDYAVAGGRVPDTVGKIGKLFRMRPIMSLDQDGKGIAFKVGFSQKGITKKIYDLVKKAHNDKGIIGYSIVHCDNPTLADQYVNDMSLMVNKKPEFVSDISSIIAMHSGPGCVAVSIMTRKE